MESNSRYNVEKYISLSHHRADGSDICCNDDTVFLSLDKERVEDTISSVDSSPIIPKRNNAARNSGNLAPIRTPGCSMFEEDDSLNDNFLAPISRFHQVTLYETAKRFFLVGSYKDGCTYKIMKIDRSASEESLSVNVDPTNYTADELNQLLNMIHEGNKGTNGLGLRRVATGDGVLGFIRFTRGYYLILITEKIKRGSIGPHQVYSVDKTGYVYIPEGKSPITPQETRYRTLFFALNFSEFYFSYSYDLTHTLQDNLTYTKKLHYNKRFAWNHFLMKPLISQGDHHQWVHPLIHGFFGQSSLTMHGRQFRITVIARRSRYFAGTRYLKRGVNMQGHVANDVETEQIAEDCNWGAMASEERFTAYVQIRGSIPLFWGQEPRTLTPKPPIFLQKCDPLYAATKLHFRDLFSRFGYPIVVLNLVKKKEKKPRESILRRELSYAINEINEPLPNEYKLRYISWDFSRAAKSEEGNVITQMTAIAEEALCATDFFHSGRKRISNRIKDPMSEIIITQGYSDGKLGKMQKGVLRSNCIDSLDRTNAAQFVVGKVALGYQLYVLGLIASPEIDFDGRLGEEITHLYQDMGNNLAMQYGGSELAHTMKSYKGSESGSRQGNRARDMFTSFRRYYSNSFMDNEKQDKINLFLGNYKPWQESTDLWDLETDYYLHMKAPSFSDKMMLYENWWEYSVAQFFKNKELRPLINLNDLQEKKEECRRSLLMEAYDLNHITSFDKKLLREQIVPLDEFPISTVFPKAYFGRKKQWISLDTNNTKIRRASSTPTENATEWNPMTQSHPDFKLGLQIIESQERINGPQHNLMSYYEISLDILERNIRLYERFVKYRALINNIPKPLFTKRKPMLQKTFPPRKKRTGYTTFEDIDLRKPVALRQEVVKSTNNNNGTKSLSLNVTATRAATDISPKNRRLTFTSSKNERIAALYSIENEVIARNTYQNMIDNLDIDNLVTPNNPKLNSKYSFYNSCLARAELDNNSAASVTTKSLLVYTQACAKIN